MAVTLNFYDNFVLEIGKGSINMQSDVFKCELHNNLIFDPANTSRAEIAATALATGNGYTNPGQDLSAVTWTQLAGVTSFDSADVLWTANGGSIGPATDAVIYSDTGLNDELCFDIDFGESKTAGDGTEFKVVPDVDGWFTIS